MGFFQMNPYSNYDENEDYQLLPEHQLQRMGQQIREGADSRDLDDLQAHGNKV